MPSARFRIGQYVDSLKRDGIELHHFPARFGSYPPSATWVRPVWLIGTMAQRLPAIVRSHSFDVTILQRELVSTLATLEEFTGHPRVLDVDDALWLLGNGRFIDRIAARCDAVLCGNSFLAEHFSKSNRNVRLLPTAVDTGRYRPGRDTSEELVIGWSGTSGAFRYLYSIESALARVLLKRPEARLRVIADRAPAFSRLPPDRVEFVAWSPATEVAALQQLSIGIMPLENSDWERGKCSYKMLLYMACGLPVVVSPVGMNRDVLAYGEIGLAAQNDSEWVEALLRLLDDRTARYLMGRNGRTIVEQQFSLDRLSSQFGQYLKGVAA